MSALSSDPRAYLDATPCLDADHPRIQALATRTTQGIVGDADRAVALYYAVRDGFWYDPYGADFSREGLRASAVVEKGHGFCVTKAGLLVAAARALGIPARPGFADVRNHLATARLRERMGTDVFYYHGYAELWLHGRWAKATPAFNVELCERFGVRPLEFDGRHDSLFHEYDANERRHMEYLRDHGPRADIPVAEIQAAMKRHYPNLEQLAEGIPGDFAVEADAERSGHRSGG